MINFGLGSFWAGLEFLHHALRQAQLAVTSGHGNDKVDVARHRLIKNNVEFAIRECAAQLVLTETNQACLALENLFSLYRDRHAPRGRARPPGRGFSLQRGTRHQP
jgi:hypothetical protein